MDNRHDTFNEELREYVKNNLGEYKVEFTKAFYRDDDIVCISIEKDNFKKAIYYNYDLARPVSNKVDGTYFSIFAYGNAYTLHSYSLGGLVRAYVGISNLDNGVILPLAYDINKREYTIFPTDENGLIDDDEMQERIKQENPLIGFKPEVYKEAVDTKNIYLVLRYFKLYQNSPNFASFVLLGEER